MSIMTRDRSLRPTASDSISREGSSIQCMSSMTITTGACTLAVYTSSATASKVSRLMSATFGRLGGAAVGAAEVHDLAERRVAGRERARVRAEPRGDLGARLVLAVVVRDPEVLAQHRDPRRVRYGLHHRRAARFEEHDGHLGEPLLELVDEPRLAAAGVADDGHDLRQRPDEPVEARDQLRELLAAADERRQPARLGDRDRGRRLGEAAHLVRHHRLALALHLEAARRQHLEEAAHETMGRVADEDHAGIGDATGGAEPGSSCRRSPCSPS